MSPEPLFPEFAGGEMRSLYGEWSDYANGCSENDLANLYNRTKEIAFAWDDNGQADWQDTTFAWVVRLFDGRYVAVTGWHDTTGWGCRSGIEVVGVEATEELAARHMPDDPRHAWEEQKREREANETRRRNRPSMSLQDVYKAEYAESLAFAELPNPVQMIGASTSVDFVSPIEVRGEDTEP